MWIIVINALWKSNLLRVCGVCLCARVCEKAGVRNGFLKVGRRDSLPSYLLQSSRIWPCSPPFPFSFLVTFSTFCFPSHGTLTPLLTGIFSWYFSSVKAVTGLNLPEFDSSIVKLISSSELSVGFSHNVLPSSGLSQNFQWDGSFLNGASTQG